MRSAMARNNVRAATPNVPAGNSSPADGPDILDTGPNPDDTRAVDFADEARQPIGARPASTITDSHDPDAGADETQDGLSETEEEVRHAAEDVPDYEDDDVPVFEEADAVPKLFDDEKADEDEEQDEEEEEDDEDEDEEDDDDDDDDDDEEADEPEG